MDAGSVLDVAFLYFYDYDSIGSTIEISDVTLDNGDVFCGSEDSDSDSRYLFFFKGNIIIDISRSKFLGY